MLVFLCMRAAMADPSSKAGDFTRPGHIFPLRAVPGGVLVRDGHTEAGVDLSRYDEPPQPQNILLRTHKPHPSPLCPQPNILSSSNPSILTRVTVKTRRSSSSPGQPLKKVKCRGRNFPETLTRGSDCVSRLAGLSPVGVLSEICTEDMTGMMRVPELKLFAAKHGLVMTSVRGENVPLRTTAVFSTLARSAHAPTYSLGLVLHPAECSAADIFKF